MNLSRDTWCALLGAAGLLLSSGKLVAATRSFHPTACGAAASSNNNANFADVSPGGFFNQATNSGQYQNGSIAQGVLYCPLVTDPTVNLPSTAFPDPVIVSMYSNGYGTSSQTYAKACRVFAAGGGTGQSCSGVSLPANGAGVNQIQVQVQSGGSSSDYYYLIVSLGPRDPVSGSLNTFFGYSISN